MNLSVRANLFGGQFSISHTLNCIDFKSAFIVTSLMDNLKDHKLYGRVTLKGYDTQIDENILSAMLENHGYGDDYLRYIHNFTGIILTVPLPNECVSDDFDENMDVNKRLRFYNCFLENFMNHMIACGMTPFFFRYDINNDVMPRKYTAEVTVMIPTFDNADEVFFDITKFSALECINTSAPHFDPLNGYEKTDAILKIPDGFHLENVTLHSYSTGNDEMDEWHVLVPNKTKPESN